MQDENKDLARMDSSAQLDKQRATAPTVAPDATDDGWWPCGCVKGGNWKLMRPSTHIRLNPPSSVTCKDCGCTRADAIRIEGR